MPGSISAFLAILLATAASPALQQWRVETVDQSGAGSFSSIKVDNAGNVHLAYTADNGFNHTLKYAFWQRTLGRWFTMNVDEHAAFCSLVLDSKQYPHISYVDAGSVVGSKLRYAYWDGKAWRKQAIPLNDNAISYYTSIALDSHENPTISFYEYEGAAGVGFVLRMRAVTWNGTFWAARTIDEQPGSGKFNSLAIDSKEQIQVAYANVKAEHGSLRYAIWNGKKWEHELLEGAAEPVPIECIALLLDKQDTPHIVYSDLKNRVVKYATRRDSKWKIETVDSVSHVAYPDRNGIALDENGDPYVSYYDAGLGLLKLAHRVQGKWYATVIDRNFSGFTSSVVVDRGRVWVAYADQPNRSLKVAWSDIAAPLSTALHSSGSQKTGKSE